MNLEIVQFNGYYRMECNKLAYLLKWNIVRLQLLSAMEMNDNYYSIVDIIRGRGGARESGRPTTVRANALNSNSSVGA